MFDSIGLKDLELGEARTFENITMVPLYRETKPTLDYISLDEALEQKQIDITEVNEAGSVPNLNVINKGKRSVLIVDGEEIIGAKQNRVVNTSLLLLGETTTTIPVSCTEQGRWHHVSPKFSKSDTVLNREARRRKMRSVSRSYKSHNEAHSDQGEVWNEINKLEAKANYKSKSSAMKDVYDQQRKSLDDCVQTLCLAEGQSGLLIGVDGRPVGYDYISLSPVYARLHNKLLRSYIIDPLLETKGGQSATGKDAMEQFVESASQSKGERYASPAAGWDYRLEAPGLSGASLEYEEEQVHQAFFSTDELAKPFRRRNLRN